MTNRNPRAKTATANKPKLPAQKNTATPPRAEVAVVHVAEPTGFQDPHGNGIVALAEDDDDPAGLRMDMPDDDSPVLDLHTQQPLDVQELGEYDDFHEQPRGSSFESDVDFTPVEFDDDMTDDERLETAHRLQAQAEAMMAQARQLVGAGAPVDQVPPAPVQRQVAPAPRVRQAVVGDTIVAEVPQRKRVLRTNVDVGPIYYGDATRPMELKKGVKYEVPEHIYEYLLERDLIWSMS